MQKKLETHDIYVRVKESLNQMISILEKNIRNKRSNLLESNLNKYLFEKNQITEHPKFRWFKGSRYR